MTDKETLSEWAALFFKPFGFVLTFGFCGFVFVLGMFCSGNFVFREDRAPSRCQFSLCLTAWFAQGADPKQKWGVFSWAFQGFERNTHWKSDTEILNMHMELEENILVAQSFF